MPTEPARDGESVGSAMAAMDRAVRALALALPGIVWDDVYERWCAVKKAVHTIEDSEGDVRGSNKT